VCKIQYIVVVFLHITAKCPSGLLKKNRKSNQKAQNILPFIIIIKQSKIFNKMDDFFKMDDVSQCVGDIKISFGKKTTKPLVSIGHTNRQNFVNTQKQLKEHMQKVAIKKWCTLCQYLNLDPLTMSSIKIILFIFSKVEGINDCVYETCADVYESVDWQKIKDNKNEIYNLFNSISDWVTIFGFCHIKQESALDLSENKYIQDLKRILESQNLQEICVLEPTFIAMAIIYMSPVNCSASMMLERFIGLKHDIPDLEIKCLRTTSQILDQKYKESDVEECIKVCLNAMEVSPNFTSFVVKVLEENEEEDNTTPVQPQGRLQLRILRQKIHKETVKSSTETFENWCLNQRFNRTTSMLMQKLLYFIKCQKHNAEEQQCRQYFNEDTLSRMSNTPIVQIETKTIIEVIASIRVYEHNIPHLIDFRQECFHGFPLAIKNNLTLPKIIQLYVAAYQHESIREHVWRSIVNVYNHTIAVAIDQFTQKRPFLLARVVETIVNIHLRKQKIGSNDYENQAARQVCDNEGGEEDPSIE